MTDNVSASALNTGSTLSEFLLQAHTQYIIFDFGRGIRPIDNQVFFEWENQQSPCAYPRQGHMWSCIVFWNEQLSQERYIWFVKLPVDESGLLMQASRDAFIEIIVNALGKELEHNQDKHAQLPENPYVFSPSQQQLADCNAHIRRRLNLEMRDIQNATAYLQAPNIRNNEHQWAELSVQDLADFVIYPKHTDTHADTKDRSLASQHHSQDIIAANLSIYPLPVLSALFASLESVELNRKLSAAIIDYHQTVFAKNTSHAALAIRAMSFKADDACQSYIKELLADSCALDMETCIVIAGRFWYLLNDKNLLCAYMEKVLNIDPSRKLFASLYADLVKIPTIRDTVLAMIRDPQRSEEMAKAIGDLFNR